MFMKFNSLEINEKTFRKKMFGLDSQHVFDFLRRLSVEMDMLTKDKADLKKKLREVEVHLQEYKERDELLKNTIANATKMSDRIRTDSERESKLIINDSKQRAETIIRDAKDSLKAIYNDVSDLKRVRMQFENNLRALMQSHIAMLDQGQGLMPNPEVDPITMRPKVNNQSLAGSTAMGKQVSDMINESLTPRPSMDI